MTPPGLANENIPSDSPSRRYSAFSPSKRRYTASTISPFWIASLSPGARLRGDRQGAAAPIHAEQLQQIQNPDLLQVAANIAALGDRPALAAR